MQISPPNQETPTTFAADFRRFFLRGLAMIAPPLITLGILVWVFNFVDRNIGQYVTEGMIRIMAAGGRQPTLVTIEDSLEYGEKIDEFDAAGRRLTREYKLLSHPMAGDAARNRVLWEVLFRKYHLNLVGFLLGILLIYFLGYSLGSLLGRSAWHLLERGFFRLPVVKAVYPYVKQVTDLVLSEKKLDVSAVVGVEFPRAGCWALGLVVSPGFEPFTSRLGGDVLTVFVMTSPTPFTGFPLLVRRDEVIELPMTLDEAMRFVVSCGVLTPGSRRGVQLQAQSPWKPGPRVPREARDAAERQSEANA